jgi:hypothetical protein
LPHSSMDALKAGRCACQGAPDADGDGNRCPESAERKPDQDAHAEQRLPIGIRFAAVLMENDDRQRCLIIVSSCNNLIDAGSLTAGVPVEPNSGLACLVQAASVLAYLISLQARHFRQHRRRGKRAPANLVSQLSKRHYHPERKSSARVPKNFPCCG